MKKLLALLLLSTPLLAAEPAPSPRAKGDATPLAVGAEPMLLGPKSAPYMLEVKVRNVPNGTVIWWDVAQKAALVGGSTAWVEAADVQTRVIKAEQALIFAGPKGQYRVRCRLTKGNDAVELTHECELTAGVAPTPTPPVPPGPKPPDPLPPAKTFNVILVYPASGLSQAQHDVIYGGKLEDWMRAQCTLWRRRDYQAQNVNDPASKAFWDTVKPSITVVPCVAVERDDPATGKLKYVLVDVEPTQEKMIEVLKSLKGG